ncbi:HAD-IIB family hydrolase [Kiritimatiella glycovorans]|uniref:sucrose-phosphate synthase n=1 Tax=Kiritimatiella glycovorans TaxID=1307763 RepID=A0A0G3EII1_9BACT|nr:HAD-IIB family hydrolase [Kiritimatiella glycovorans]AKJ65247.1 Sucrose-phosphate synthase [Kiritimatiella glycovorans]
MSAKQSDGGLYIVMLSVHGLIRGHDLELGRDPDTGGQVTYVVELVRALAKHPEVGRVDLFTRQVADKRVGDEYAQPEEELSECARIVRIPCGPRRYLRKENLWPYLPVFVDHALGHFRRMGRLPDVVHGHYADAGYAGSQLARLLGVPFVFTGHSLGRIKRRRLLEQGADPEQIDRKYRFIERIEAEETALDTAALVCASTRQEVSEQYEEYDFYRPDTMEVIPPGVDLSRFRAPEENFRCRMEGEVERFLRDPEKPVILAMARPDERKNIETLVRAYGENEALREQANLLLILGNREDIRKFPAAQRKVLFQILYLIDYYDLYGHVAFPKQHDAEDVPNIYRMAARRRGVFVNPAWTEPFGLTLIEASASGLPIVATNDGGPRDIIAACRNGVLIDPFDPDALSEALLEAIGERRQWETWSKNGIKGSRETFSWESHVEHYLAEVRSLVKGEGRRGRISLRRRSRLPTIDRVLITDVDNTLTGDEEGCLELVRLLHDAGDYVGFGIATGRTRKSALKLLKEIGAPTPDILITSAGCNIYYGEDLRPDRSWHHHIDHYWNPDLVRAILDELPGIYPQKKGEQGRYKVSYTLDPEKGPSLKELRGLLRQRRLRVKVIFSLGMYLDILPIRASTGLAIRYLALKWGLPPERLLVAGDSGNDEEMLRGETLGVVVGNYSPELEGLRGAPRIYFAEASHARGIIEGLEHYRFLEEIVIPEEEGDTNV